MTDSPYLTIEETAALLRVPRSWVYEQARQRKIPHLKPGKRLLFPMGELVTWFEETYRREFEGGTPAFRSRRQVRARMHRR